MNGEENYVDVIENVLPDFQKAAESVARKWPQATNVEDLFQDLVVHFLEREGSLVALLKLEQEDRLKRLVAIGHEKAAKARDDFAVFSGQVSYSVEEVKALAAKGAATTTVPNHEAGSTDFQGGLEELARRNSVYADVIRRKFVTDEYDAKDVNQRKLLQRATESLTTQMNRLSATRRYSHENGGRHRSNSAARMITEEDYNGGGVR